MSDMHMPEHSPLTREVRAVWPDVLAWAHADFPALRLASARVLGAHVGPYGAVVRIYFDDDSEAEQLLDQDTRNTLELLIALKVQPRLPLRVPLYVEARRKPRLPEWVSLN